MLVSLMRRTHPVALVLLLLGAAVVVAVALYLALRSDGNGTSEVRTTQVIEFLPPAAGAPTVDGACFSPSLAVVRDNAWRCSVENGIYDPCFGSLEANSVVCLEDPLATAEAVTIRLQSLLTEVEPFPAKPESHPWALETEDDVLCTYLTGATGPVNGERLNYGCADGSSIIGDPQAGDTWTARRVSLGGSIPPPGSTVAEERVTLRRVWE